MRYRYPVKDSQASVAPLLLSTLGGTMNIPATSTVQTCGVGYLYEHLLFCL